MTPILTRFDAIYTLQRYRATRTQPKHTVFTFVDHGQYISTAYVTVPGHPRIEPGMVVLALLRRPGDWSSLVGWRDLETGEIAVQKASGRLWQGAFIAFWFALLAWMLVSGSPSLGTAILILALPAACVGGLLFFTYRAWRRELKDEQAVRALPTHVTENSAAMEPKQ